MRKTTAVERRLELRQPARFAAGAGRRVSDVGFPGATRDPDLARDPRPESPISFRPGTVAFLSAFRKARSRTRTHRCGHRRKGLSLARARCRAPFRGSLRHWWP